MKKVKKKNKSNKIVWIIIGILIIVILAGYFIYINYRKHNMANIIFNSNTDIEINDKVLLETFVKEIKNGKLINKDEVVDTAKIGKQKVVFHVKNKNNEEEEFDLTIDVVDTKKPEIEAKEEVSTYVGSKIDLLKDVKVTDNSLEEIEVKVVGEYDINKAGEYKLKYEASDSSDNKSELDFVLKVIDDPNNRVFITSKGFSGKTVNGVTYIDGVLIANKTYSLPSNYGYGLTKETQNAFNRMQADAKALGLNLWLSSGYRSYNDQKYIYNNYVARDGQAAADTYSARPGYSEHQTGLAFDLNTISDAFANTAEGKWVAENCHKYGLILRYPKGKDNITGYKYESWHLRYLGGELPSKLYNNGDWITLEEYFGIDSKYK